MPDPFTEANAAIWAALLANDDFVDKVPRKANRIATTTVADTLTSKMVNRAPADFPEVLVTQRGLQPIPGGRNSKTFDATQTYTIQIVDDQKTADRLNEVKWAALKALAVASRANPPFGLTFLRGWDWAPGTEGRELNADNQPTRNWVALFDVRFDFFWGMNELT